jgi:hypothetical protein
VKITRIELSQRLELAALKQPDHASLPFNESPLPEFLDGPVDVHGREATRISEILLPKRKFETVILQQSDDLQSGRQLANEVRQPRQRSE